jgi:CrcB protein
VSAPAWIAVGLLGGLAAGARFALDSEVSLRANIPFPVGILIVNLLGALAVGALAASGIDGEVLTILGSGTIGSFTTFATWMLDTRELNAAKRSRLAWLNICLSLLAGFLAVALGHLLASLSLG